MDSCLATVLRPPILTDMMGIDGLTCSGLSSQGSFSFILSFGEFKRYC